MWNKTPIESGVKAPDQRIPQSFPDFCAFSKSVIRQFLTQRSSDPQRRAGDRRPFFGRPGRPELISGARQSAATPQIAGFKPARCVRRNATGKSLPRRRCSRSGVLVVAEEAMQRVFASLGDGIRQLAALGWRHRHERPRQRGVTFDEAELWHSYAGEADRQR